MKKTPFKAHENLTGTGRCYEAYTTQATNRETGATIDFIAPSKAELQAQWVARYAREADPRKFQKVYVFRTVVKE